MSSESKHDGEYAEFQPIHPEPTSLLSKWFSTDHKVIARQFLWTGLFFLLFGGTMAMVIRWQWAYPGESVPMIFGGMFLNDGVVNPSSYNQLSTMHGLIMIFWAITPMMIGAFGNLTIPLLIGARDMAFPFVNMLSYHTFLLSGVFIVASFFMPMGSHSAMWITYPPLSTNVGTPGLGPTLVLIAIFLTGTATIMGAVNYITTVVRLRAPGMTYFRLPMTIWGQWLTAILNLLFVPVLAAGVVLLIMDREYGTHFFVSGSSGLDGDPILFQHLFWIFGHPEVYILILPAWGFIGDLLPFFSRKPHFWYRGTVLSFIAVTVLSAVVYGHHMYTTGMNPLLGQSFMMLTLIISVPAEILFLNWLHTMWHGSIRMTVPMVFAMGTVFVFGLGGLTGIYLATISTDIYLHDSMFVTGHFHLTMAAAAFLGTFGAIYYWFPKMYGKMMNSKLGQIHAWGSIIFITIVFCGQMAAGWAGQPRWFWDPYRYTFLEGLLNLNKATSHAAFALAAVQVLFVINWVYTIFAGKKSKEKNPWRVGTLEWSIESPPVHHNFDVIPTVNHGPHEFAHPDAERLFGRDYLAQDDPPLDEVDEDKTQDSGDDEDGGEG